LADKQ